MATPGPTARFASRWRTSTPTATDCVVAVHHSTATRGGKNFDGRECIVFDIVDDKAAVLSQCEEDVEAFDRFWA